MDTSQPALSPHPSGEQPSVEDWSATADTFGGRVHVEWDSGGLVTPLGQLPFYIEYLKQAGLFAGGLPADGTVKLRRFGQNMGARGLSSCRVGRAAPLRRRF